MSQIRIDENAATTVWRSRMLAVLGAFLLSASTALATEPAASTEPAPATGQPPQPEQPAEEPVPIVVRPLPGSSLVLDPLSTPLGGAAKVDLRLEAIRSVSTKDWVTRVVLADGTVLEGRASGRLVGSGPDGALDEAWQGLASVRLEQAETEAPELPEGLRITIAGDGVESLELHGVEIRETWLKPEGTHKVGREVVGPAAYFPQEGEVVTATVPFSVYESRRPVVEVSLPLRSIRWFDVLGGWTETLVAVDGGFLRFTGLLGSHIEQSLGSVVLVGRSAIGTFTLSPDSIRGALGRLGKAGAKVRVSLDPGGLAAVEPGAPVGIAGRIETWDGQEYPLIAAAAELKLRVGDEERTIELAALSRLEVSEDPRGNYRKDAPQWLDGRVTLVDGTTASGEVSDDYGTVRVLGPGGLEATVASTWVRELELSGVPAEGGAGATGQMASAARAATE